MTEPVSPPPVRRSTHVDVGADEAGTPLVSGSDTVAAAPVASEEEPTRGNRKPAVIAMAIAIATLLAGLGFVGTSILTNAL